MDNKKVILSGMRPSGRLHLGNHSVLQNWIRLQNEYHCYYFIADWHALTTGYQETEDLTENIKEMLLDWLSAGLDPERSVIFRQSAILEHAELYLLLAMITPISWLERCPTFKEQLRQLEGKDINTYGFLGYPLLQAADILAYRADAVPVGEDQSPHIEFTREIARRFNYLYRETFPEPESLFASKSMVPGTDGRKMSKSYDNYILLSDPPEEIKQKVRLMLTDPQRARRRDPGRPEVCPVFEFQKLFNREGKPEIEESCRKASMGCVQCKEALSRHLCQFLEPFQEKRRRLMTEPRLLTEILESGNQKAAETARKTLYLVREAMRL